MLREHSGSHFIILGAAASPIHPPGIVTLRVRFEVALVPTVIGATDEA